MQTITIGLVQMRCEKGAIDDNLASIYASLKYAFLMRNFPIVEPSEA